jgi:hypothetical protein
MKKCVWLPLLSAVLIASSIQAEMRTFTSPDGRTLEGEIVSATPDMVTLKLASGQTLAAPINKFSDSDQAFILSWRKENPQTIKYAFAAGYTKEKIDSRKSSSGATTITSEKWICKMKITNRSGETLENVKVDYDIYLREMGSGVMRNTKGSATIASIKHLQELALATSPVTVESSQLSGGYYYTDGSRSRQKGSLEGMMISLSHEGKQVFQWTSPGAPAGGGTATGTAGSLFGN